MTDFKLCKTDEGLELIIDTQTGEVFASQSAIARMVGVSQPAISGWVTHNQISSEQAEILTTTGLKTHKLYTEDTIYLAFLKYKPELLVQCAKAGIRVYLHTIAGYKVTSSATQPQLTPPKLLELEQAVQLTKEVIAFQGKIPEALRQIFLDQISARLEPTSAILNQPRRLGVVQKAEELGYRVSLSNRTKLGKFVKSQGLPSTEEERLCNGQLRKIKVYEDCMELERIVHLFFSQVKTLESSLKKS